MAEHLVERVLGHPSVYRAWQAPFAGQKLRPLLSRIDLTEVGRILDVGCGPGTNGGHFAPDRYVGVDLSSKYIDYARQHYRHRFEVWDITKPGPDLGVFDLVLINSVFHHLNDDEVRAVLSGLGTFAAREATVSIIDLILPSDRNLARFLGRSDRGDYPRELEHWRSLIGASLNIDHIESFQVGLLGVRMWDLVYLEAKLNCLQLGPDSSGL